MISQFLKSLFGSRNQRILKRLTRVVASINQLENEMRALSDTELQAKTAFFKSELNNGKSVDDLLPQAFAVVREASRRVLNMRHFDVQLIGGMVLHAGNIAEMRTGEGKTLAATLPAYLNALTGKGVHIITVNDYLVKRDAAWMAPIYHFLGLTTGVVVANMSPEEKRAAYAADVVYGTNNEFGFDYLRDNMAFTLQDRVQRALHFAIVDEVDSILIDEARTPLIISGPAEDSSALYLKINTLIPRLTKQSTKESPGDYHLDEKNKLAHLSEEGHQKIEALLSEAGLLQANTSLYDVTNISLMHHVYAALRAHTLFQKNVDYIVENNEVVIIDEHTGRKMVGRRWSEGLHQAIEAKEGAKIQNENQTLASITFQNYFRLYQKLSGMTGTADTEAYEFQQIYGLEVVVIPTHKLMMRADQADLVYMTQKDKFAAIIQDIKSCIERAQPVLVGTASIETSEYLSALLKKENITHQVLNAKFHEKEAEIIAQAGRPSAVTIATNMAGRGTDIVLGGNVSAEIKMLKTDEEKSAARAAWQKRNEAVVKSNGLRIIGSERHESRRIDNQLRGRAGRQGDPGSSRFYLSLEDNLLRIFAADRLQGLMRRVGMKEGDSLESQLLTRVIENAQRKVESHHFDVRKQLLEFDNVANDQRKVVYQQRAELMELNDVQETMRAIRQSVLNKLISSYLPDNSMVEQWDLAGLEARLASDFNLKVTLTEDEALDAEAIRDLILKAGDEAYLQKEASLTSPVMRHFEKTITLQILDQHWREHLTALDYLRQGIHLRGYAQKNPKQEYKREAFTLFSAMLDSIKYEVLSTLMSFQVTPQGLQTIEAREQQHAASTKIHLQHSEVSPWQGEVAEGATPHRNDPCPCGSGKKFKYCHGKL